jgi:hypothetical protein
MRSIPRSALFRDEGLARSSAADGLRIPKAAPSALRAVVARDRAVEGARRIRERPTLGALQLCEVW